MGSYKEYADNERKRYNDMVQLADKAPLLDRRVAGTEWRDAMLFKRQEIEDTIDHIYAGNYGPHPKLLIEGIRDGSKRMNKQAQLGQLVAFLYCQCTGTEARKAWKSLNEVDRNSIDSLLITALHKESNQDEDYYDDDVDE